LPNLGTSTNGRVIEQHSMDVRAHLEFDLWQDIAQHGRGDAGGEQIPELKVCTGLASKSSSYHLTAMILAPQSSMRTSRMRHAGRPLVRAGSLDAGGRSVRSHQVIPRPGRAVRHLRANVLSWAIWPAERLTADVMPGRELR